MFNISIFETITYVSPNDAMSMSSATWQLRDGATRRIEGSKLGGEDISDARQEIERNCPPV